jgi:hypothetical protein
MRDEHAITPSQVKSGLIGSQLLAISIWKDGETKALAEAMGAVKLLDKSNLATQLIPAIRHYANEQGRD